MPLETEIIHENQLVVRATGKLTKEDYEAFLPKVDQLVRDHDRISILFDIQNLHGWHATAAWEDAKFAFHHFKDVERLAVVGEKRWHKVVTMLSKPFTQAEVRYFTGAQSEQAHQWLNELPAPH
jgi:hypothetical protein